MRDESKSESLLLRLVFEIDLAFNPSSLQFTLTYAVICAKVCVNASDCPAMAVSFARAETI